MTEVVSWKGRVSKQMSPHKMIISILITTCTFFPVCEIPSVKQLAADSFLVPYIQQLKKDTPTEDLRKITAMADSELILLLHGFGTDIRNKWLLGNRDPKLVRFFVDNKVSEPENMSMIIIKALWNDLNSSLTPEQRASVEKKRVIVARKRETYKKLEAECRAHLMKAKDEFEQCYAKNGLPSKEMGGEGPFFKLIVEKSGRVRRIIFYKGTSPKLKSGLRKIINSFTFSDFGDDEFVTLHITEFPNCRITERDSIHN